MMMMMMMSCSFKTNPMKNSVKCLQAMNAPYLTLAEKNKTKVKLENE